MTLVMLFTYRKSSEPVAPFGEWGEIPRPSNHPSGTPRRFNNVERSVFALNEKSHVISLPRFASGGEKCSVEVLTIAQLEIRMTNPATPAVKDIASGQASDLITRIFECFCERIMTQPRAIKPLCGIRITAP